MERGSRNFPLLPSNDFWGKQLSSRWSLIGSVHSLIPMVICNYINWSQWVIKLAITKSWVWEGEDLGAGEGIRAKYNQNSL